MSNRKMANKGKAQSVADALTTKFKSTIRAACYSFGGAVCAGAVLLITSSAPAQNLFVLNHLDGIITEFTPGGAQSTFASGLIMPIQPAFDSAGNLFVARRIPRQRQHL